MNDRIVLSLVAGVAKHLYGTFAESETDRCLDQLLGYYLKAKVCWNPNFDWESAIEEFYERMFGRAAAPMKRALETIERKFTHDAAVLLPHDRDEGGAHPASLRRAQGGRGAQAGNALPLLVLRQGRPRADRTQRRGRSDEIRLEEVMP